MLRHTCSSCHVPCIAQIKSHSYRPSKKPQLGSHGTAGSPGTWKGRHDQGWRQTGWIKHRYSSVVIKQSRGTLCVKHAVEQIRRVDQKMDRNSFALGQARPIEYLGSTYYVELLARNPVEPCMQNLRLNATAPLGFTWLENAHALLRTKQSSSEHFLSLTAAQQGTVRKSRCWGSTTNKDQTILTQKSSIFIYVYFCIYLSIYLSAYLSIYLSVYVQYLCICLSIYLSIYLSFFSFFLSIYLSACLSIWQSIYLPISLSACLRTHACMYRAPSIAVAALIPNNISSSQERHRLRWWHPAQTHCSQGPTGLSLNYEKVKSKKSELSGSLQR